MDKQTAYYVLSTLAQTCAALAAFVGAVGLFRLGALETGREMFLDTLRRHLSLLTPPQAAVLAAAEKEATTTSAIRDVLASYKNFSPEIQRTGKWFIIFEACNLVAILASILGLIWIDGLVKCPLAPLGIAALTLVAVASTGIAVAVWFPRR